MAYSQTLAERVRRRFAKLPMVEEKAMMGGLVFMLEDKMCVGIVGDSLLCRVDQADVPELLRRPGCRPMDFTGRPMRSFVVVDPEGIDSTADFEGWIALALEFNRFAKPAKKRAPKTS